MSKSNCLKLNKITNFIFCYCVDYENFNPKFNQIMKFIFRKYYTIISVLYYLYFYYFHSFF